MNHEQILKKAICKAIVNGWDAFGTESQQIDVEVVKLIDGELQPDIDVDKPGIYICIYRHHGTYSVPELIYNHDFCEALWGTEPDEEYEASPSGGRWYKTMDAQKQWEIGGSYLYHLQQMVITNEPIQYLAQYV